MSGADFRQILCGMYESKQNIILYADLSLSAIKDIYNEEIGFSKKKSDDLKN